jgi:hypothetical protein
VEKGLREAEQQRRQEARDLSILNQWQDLEEQEEQEETQARPSQGFQFINTDVYRLTAVNDVKDLPTSIRKQT